MAAKINLKQLNIKLWNVFIAEYFILKFKHHWIYFENHEFIYVIFIWVAKCKSSQVKLFRRPNWTGEVQTPGWKLHTLNSVNRLPMSLSEFDQTFVLSGYILSVTWSKKDQILSRSIHYVFEIVFENLKLLSGNAKEGNSKHINPM